MKTAIVYDRVNKWGGAERVILALHELFPQADLYTSVYNKKRASWAKVFTVVPSLLNRFPKASTMHELLATFMPVTFESFSFDTYDLVISVTSEAAKGIVTKPRTLHVCYCLTPTRYLWSGYDEYFKSGIFRFISYPLVSYLRFWDKLAANRPDVLVAISDEVKKRILEYYNISAPIIYPPVSLYEEYEASKSLKHEIKKPAPGEHYFLVVSRLVPYKRIDLAVKVCSLLSLPLKIVGTGSESRRLRNIAGPTIEFLGSLTDAELLGYYRGCEALIFPGREDFGLAIVEAQSFGKPVIAFGKGAALETIVNGRTGLFFYNQTQDALKEQLLKFKKWKRKFRSADAVLQSHKFTKKLFKDSFATLVKEELEKQKQNK